MSIPFNLIVFFAVFALQGYTSSSFWPSLAYVFYFYSMAVLISLRSYQLQRLLLFAFFAISVAVSFAGKVLLRPVTWLELSIVSGLAVVVFTKSEIKRKWGAFALLALAWTEGEAFLRRISPEPNFWVASRTAWETISGHAEHEWLPSLITIGIGRSIYLLAAASLALGIYLRRRNLAELSIPQLVPHLPVFPKLPAREIKRPRNKEARAGVLVELVFVFVDILLFLVNIAVMVFCLVINFLIGAGEWLIRFAARILDITLRAMIYLCCLVALIVAGTAEALWLSFLETLRSLAVACLLWLVPLAVSLVFVQASISFVRMVDATLRARAEANWTIPSLFLFGSFIGCLIIGTWALAPRGDCYGWWREREETESSGVGILHEKSVLQFSNVWASAQNYLKRAAVFALGAYILNLIIFDTYGHFRGGPYDYGTPFFLSVVLLVLGCIALLWLKLRS